MQAPLLDGLSFEPISLFDDPFRLAEIGFARPAVFEALVIALVNVLPDERFDLRFQIGGELKLTHAAFPILNLSRDC
jgi:hypothetical protein